MEYSCLFPIELEEDLEILQGSLALSSWGIGNELL